MNDEPVKVLVVEDERNHARMVAELLERAGYAVAVAMSFDEGKTMLLEGRPDIVVTDLVLGVHRGTELLQLARGMDPRPEVMLISGVGNIDDAVEAMRLGAAHYFQKPLDVAQMRSVIANAARRIVAARSPGRGEVIEGPQGFHGIIGGSAPMRELYEMIRRVAPTTATVLIQGENGTGKELVARAIHDLSPRSSAAFVGLNCGALTEGILESELFGHERGAFTGAAKSHEGKFEYADGGTLFLDEIGEMPIGLQVKLLRVIQEREVTRLGSNRTINVDVRLLAATNRDLEKAIAGGSFREDLYYRIKVVTLRVPPLRERRDDIVLLARHFFELLTERHGRQDLSGISDEVLEILQNQEWPGNVRELQNVMETMVLLGKGPELEKGDLPPDIQPAEKKSSTALVSLERLENLTLDQWERELIRLQLKRQEGNRARAAKALGISERTLYRKIKEYGLT